MNSNKKNTKKILIIGGIVAALFIVVLMLVLSNDETSKTSKETINCSFEKKSQIMSITVNMKVDYVNDEFKFVEEEYEMELLNEKLIQQKDSIFEKMETRMLEQFNGIDLKHNFERKENSMIIKLSMDSENYELYNKNAKNTAEDDSLNSSEYHYGAESLKQYVESLGGECQYE